MGGADSVHRPVIRLPVGNERANADDKERAEYFIKKVEESDAAGEL